MNSIDEVISDLKKLEARRAALTNIPEQIQILENAYTALRAAKTDGDPVSGGTNNRENILIDNIDKRMILKKNYEIIKAEVEMMDRNLAALTKNERLVLTRFFINKEKYAIDRLTAELGYEQAQIYRLRDAALRNLAMRMYGVIEI